MIIFLHNIFIQQGISADMSALLARGIAITMVIFFASLANFLTKRLLLSGLARFISHTTTTWDDTLLKHRVFDHLSHFSPAIVIILLTPMALGGYPNGISITTDALSIYMIALGVMTIDALLNGFMDVYQTYDVSKKVPIKVFVQVSKITLYFVGCIFVVSILVNESPIYLLSGLGALTAIFMLIFKDAILGFVAGIQLTANKMVSTGDWVEMPKYGADGDVIEVSLTTVKIQNWDKTITTIPTYALISESFKNWRGMSESGGRRIKRAIYIDLNTVQFCTEEMLKKFSKIHLLSEYLDTKSRELPECNTNDHLDDSSLLNGRRLTNIGTFRAYVVSFLENHPQIHHGMTFLVRQLAPTEHGLPIEIYVFSKDTNWTNYEAIQADIFDHLLSAVPEFQLKVFQDPSGSDFRGILKESHESLTDPKEIR